MRRFVLAVSALVLTGCGSSERSIEVKDPNGESATVSMKRDGEEVKVSTADGEVVFKGGGEGAQFPAYAPQYPGSTVVSSTNFSGIKGAQGLTIIQQTSDELQKVVGFYRRSIGLAGMQIVTQQAASGSSTLVAAKPGEEGKGGMVYVVQEAPGETTISITSAGS